MQHQGTPPGGYAWHLTEVLLWHQARYVSALRTNQDPVLSSSVSLHISSLCVAFQDMLEGFVLSRSCMDSFVSSRPFPSSCVRADLSHTRKTWKLHVLSMKVCHDDVM